MVQVNAYEPALNKKSSRALTGTVFVIADNNNSMFAHRHLSSIPRQCTKVRLLCPFSSTSPVAFPTQAEGKDEEKGDGDWSAPKDPTWAVWKDTDGKPFEKPHRPCNWLGGKVVECTSRTCHLFRNPDYFVSPSR